MTNFELLAIQRAEKIGVINYEVNEKKGTMSYISYFGKEGFYKVVRNLLTGEETRTPQKSTKKPYNYFCG